MSYSIVGEDEMRETFYMNPTTGELTLQQSVLESDDSQFRVSPIQASNGVHLQAGFYLYNIPVLYLIG